MLPASRLVADPERFPDEREELNAVGMGAVYERTTTGAVLRRPSGEERSALIEEYFAPYAEGIADLVRDRLAAVGKVAIVDVHSYPLVKNSHELHGYGPRPEICIGTDPFHTPSELAAAATSAMRTPAPSGEIGVNSPFDGYYVPLDEYGHNPAVQGVMLEIRRDVVAGRLQELHRGTATLVDAIQEGLRI